MSESVQPGEREDYFWLVEPNTTKTGGSMMRVQHTHTEYVEGCFRCDLSREEDRP